MVPPLNTHPHPHSQFSRSYLSCFFSPEIPAHKTSTTSNACAHFATQLWPLFLLISLSPTTPLDHRCSQTHKKDEDEISEDPEWNRTLVYNQLPYLYLLNPLLSLLSFSKHHCITCTFAHRHWNPRNLEFVLLRGCDGEFQTSGDTIGSFYWVH